MSDEKPIGVRVQRPYATREEYLDAEADLLGRSHVTLVGTKPRAPGTLLRFEVVLLSGEPVIRAEGRVVGPREIGTETGLQVKLTRIDNRTKAILDEAAQRKAAKSVLPARNPSQADTAPPPAPAAGPPPLPAPARSSAVPPPLPLPEELRSGDDVVSAATQELAALLEPESDAPSAPATDPEAAAGPASEPEAAEPEAAEPEPEPEAVEAEPEPEAAEPEPEPVEAEPEAAAPPEAAAFPAPDPVLAAAPPAIPEAVPEPAPARRDDPATGPHDRNALLARLRSRLRHDA